MMIMYDFWIDIGLGRITHRVGDEVMKSNPFFHAIIYIPVFPVDFVNLDGVKTHRREGRRGCGSRRFI